MWEFLLDLLFPKRCVSCREPGSYLCSSCFSQIKLIKNPLCPVCERAAVGGATHPHCLGKYSLDGLTSIYVYRGSVKAAIHRLKYRPWITDLGKLLTETISQRADLKFLEKDRKEWLVVPVPLHKSRKRERGFNQSEILGRLLAQKLGLTFAPNLLSRQRKTKSQVEFKGKQRQENVKGAFRLNQKVGIKNDKLGILLVDDIWTTGATLKNCGNILKKAGFKKVWALTLAR